MVRSRGKMTSLQQPLTILKRKAGYELTEEIVMKKVRVGVASIDLNDESDLNKGKSVVTPK